MFVLVGGWPGSGKSTLARDLAACLDLPYLAKDEVKEALMSRLGTPADIEESRRIGEAAVVAVLTVARRCEGAVIDSTWFEYSRPWVERLQGPIVEARCLVPLEVAKARFAGRSRDSGHFDDQRTEDELWVPPVAPLGVGPLVEVDTSGPVDVPALTARIRALARAPSSHGTRGEAGDGARQAPRSTPRLDALEEIYGQISSVVAGLVDEDFARPSRAAGWTLQDLLLHMLLDPQRALVTFATPGDDEPDVDAVTYWRDYNPRKGDGGAGHARFVTQVSAAYTSPHWLVSQLAETYPAVVRAGRHCGHARVATQGHVLDLADFVDTLIVEVTVHYLDLTVELDAPGVASAGLDVTCRVLDGLLGEPLRTSWGPVEYVLKGTGRSELSVADRSLLGDQVDRFPLLG